MSDQSRADTPILVDDAFEGVSEAQHYLYKFKRVLQSRHPH